ncbi:hypothetical protein AACH10_00805 [Ideonella sp. DXS22W]|uniref:Uncharacterized protein n=1 Tax=Pseudaquabacterium inlustre TaxID=2984192 RepID=A0ABU9CE52_9BURK
MKSWIKHPFVIAAGLGLAVLLVAAALPLLHLGQPGGGATADARRPDAADANLPWQVRALGDGRSQVFGLTLGSDTLAQAEARFGDNLQLALVARLGEVGALEALVDPMSAGFVSGRLVLAFDVPEATLRRWRANVGGSEAMEGGVRRFTLRAADRDEARRAPLAGLSFIPALRLGEADLRERFGPPDQVQAEADGVQRLLYPERGLAASVRAGQRGVLQYVAPRDFAARLGAPAQGKP